MTSSAASRERRPRPPPARSASGRLGRRWGAQHDLVAGRGRDQVARRWCRRSPGRGRRRPGGRRCPAARSSGGWRPAPPGPAAASARRKPRIQMMPSGSMPLNGSSSISTGGSPSIAAAMPEPLAHAERVAARLAPAAGSRPDLADHLVDPAGGQALGAGQPQQVVAGAAGWAAARPRPAARRRGVSGCRRRPVRPAADQRAARVGGVQAEDHPHRGRLARPVRADEAGDLPGLDGEGHAVQRQRRPEPLAQPGDFNGCFVHAWQVLRRRRRCQPGVGG